MKRNSRKDKRNKFIASRRGVVMIAVIALLILIINIITASYSWFTPQNVNGTGMQYSYSGSARSEDCHMSTFLGTKVTGSIGEGQENYGYYINQIRYANTARTTSVTIAAGATQYFKTEIINQDTKYASCISLYITSIGNISATNTCTLAVTFPSNSVRTLTAQSNNFIIRNAYVKRKDTQDVNGPGLLSVEWFVKNNGATAIAVNPSHLYLTYS